MNIYSKRRQALCDEIGNGLIVLASCPLRMMNDDVEYPYRQDSTFYYYTGFDESDSLALIDNTGDSPVYHLFVTPRDPEQETWVGEKWGLERAKTLFGADYAHSNEMLVSKLMSIVDGAEPIVNNNGKFIHVYHSLVDRMSEQVSLIMNCFRNRNGVTFLKRQLRSISDRLRLVKDTHEIDLMKRASQISGEAHTILMAKVKPGMNERELNSLFTYHVTKNGCDRLAYPNIVAGGNNATTLHYEKNNQDLGENDLLLVDAGGEFEHYAADITRTYPINGKFSPAQAAVYQIVLDTQKACIEMVKPGVSRADLQEKSNVMITQGLIRIGVLPGTLEENLEKESYRRFYMHSFGHYIGLDVHDCKEFPEWRVSTMYPGYVTTIEPGIYIREDDESVPEQFRGIGVRIEDVILVTDDGHLNLSKSVPKEIDEIERLVTQAKMHRGVQIIK